MSCFFESQRMDEHFLVIYGLCDTYGLNFRDTYALVGLWSSFFLIIYSVFGVSKIMKWSTRFERNSKENNDELVAFSSRSTEEIFALFVSIAFVVDASTHLYKSRFFSFDQCSYSLWIVYADFSSTYSTEICKQHDLYWQAKRHNASLDQNLTTHVVQSKERENLL